MRLSIQWLCRTRFFSFLIYFIPFFIYASFDNYLNSSWKEGGHSVRQKYHLPFVQSEVSLPCAQQPAAYVHYPQPEESSPHSQSTLTLYININIILPSTLQGFHSSQVPPAFTLKFCMICHSTHQCCIIHPSCPYLFKHSNNNVYINFNGKIKITFPPYSSDCKTS